MSLFVDALVKEDDVDTLKTAIVVVLLLAVLYGVYVTLNQPDQEVPEEIAWAQQQTAVPLQVEFGGGGDASPGVTASLGDTEPWNSEPPTKVTDLAPGAAYPATASESPTAGAATTAAVASPTVPTSEYGQPPQTAGTTAAVAAPDLLTPGSVAPVGLEQSAGTETYGSQAPPSGQPASQTASGTAGYGSGGQLPTSQAPAANSTASVYAPAPSQTNAPTGSYGVPDGLDANPEMIADTAPPVADSYGASTYGTSTSAQGTSSAPAATATAEVGASSVDVAIDEAELLIQQGQHYEALLKLSFAYDPIGMSAEDRQKMRRWLDPLAAKVIYSKEHLIGAPYQIHAGETLQSIATKHSVPWQLLANINGLRDPAAAQQGMSIKVVPGPFHAELDSAASTLTLFVGRLYAGQFAVTINESNAPQPGEYQVNDKQPGHSYYAGNAQTLSPEDPQNPFGGVWIDLGNNIAIHSTANSPGQSEHHGCISLAAKDANDLYGILSLGSNVIVR